MALNKSKPKSTATSEITVPKWTDDAVPSEHIWRTCNAFCPECGVRGSLSKCCLCNAIFHEECNEKFETSCRNTFVRIDDGNAISPLLHHWVKCRNRSGQCARCYKGVRSARSLKNGLSMQCSWCKIGYHLEEKCFDESLLTQTCELGAFGHSIIPPTWIMKTSASQRVEQQTNESTQNAEQGGQVNRYNFIVKCINPCVQNMSPLLVFINPKSGGNQGSVLIRKFQSILNPRQVFDLTEDKPLPSIKMFENVPNLRILACGGDGTVGWIFSILDTLEIKPPVGVLPLGTGNDLARTLNWGASYSNQPVSDIVDQMQKGTVVTLDRWKLNCTPHNANTNDTRKSDGRKSSNKLPLDVFNNYFSLGADALIALNFHESREFRPEKFANRFTNKLYYAKLGGKGLIYRKWRYLAEHITLICDGVDMTPKLRNLQCHMLLFLNIPRYSSGTLPWGDPKPGKTLKPQRIDDGFLEVIGLTSFLLGTLQIGGHGSRICQCSSFKLTTNTIIPMQVDGEPCNLDPSVIEGNFSHKALVIQKQKHSKQSHNEVQIGVKLHLITSAGFEVAKKDMKQLIQLGKYWNTITVQKNTNLVTVRQIVSSLGKDDNGVGHLKQQLKLSSLKSWYFINSIEHCNIINEQQETEFSLSSICDMSALFITGPGMEFIESDHNPIVLELHSDPMKVGNFPVQTVTEHDEKSKPESMGTMNSSSTATTTKLVEDKIEIQPNPIKLNTKEPTVQKLQDDENDVNLESVVKVDIDERSTDANDGVNKVEQIGNATVITEESNAKEQSHEEEMLDDSIIRKTETNQAHNSSESLTLTNHAKSFNLMIDLLIDEVCKNGLRTLMCNDKPTINGNPSTSAIDNCDNGVCKTSCCNAEGSMNYNSTGASCPFNTKSVAFQTKNKNAFNAEEIMFMIMSAPERFEV